MSNLDLALSLDCSLELDIIYHSKGIHYCPHCRRTRPTYDFNRHSANKDGVQGYCKEHQREYERKWRERRKLSQAHHR